MFVVCSPQDVRSGDNIANVGVVEWTSQVGVFMLFTVRGNTYDLGNGRIEVKPFEYVRHMSEEIILEAIA